MKHFFTPHTNLKYAPFPVFLILLVTINLLMTSCIDEEPKSPAIEISESTELVLVKDWFDKNKSKLRLPEQGVNFRAESQELILPFFEKEPDWDKFHHYYFPDGREVFEINLENAEFYLPASQDGQDAVDSGVIQNIMFVKDSTENRFDPLIVRYFPDDELSLRDFNDFYYASIDEKWSGWIDLFSYDEHHLVGFRIDQGVRVSTREFSMPGAGAKTKGSEGFAYAFVCTETTYDWYQITSAGGQTSVTKLSSTMSRDCGWQDVGGGGSSGYYGGGTSGGGGSAGYNPPMIPSPNLRIEIHKSFKDNEKLMCILGKLQLTTFVKSLAIIDDKYRERNVVLQVGKTIRASANAETNDQYGSNNIVITINAARLNRGSLEMARTILHEIIHAELYVAIGDKNGSALDANFEYNFNKYVELYYKEGDGGIHHNYMAEKVVGRMADVLKQIHPYLGKQEFLNHPDVKNAFPNGLPSDFYRGMAWEGLRWTDKWRYNLPDRLKYEEYLKVAENKMYDGCK